MGIGSLAGTLLSFTGLADEVRGMAFRAVLRSFEAGLVWFMSG